MQTKKELIDLIQQGKKFNYLCFWGHTPKDEGKVDKSCMSQWFPMGFIIESICQVSPRCTIPFKAIV